LSRFPVQPTPDDGVRRSAEPVWDESTRPSGPPSSGHTYTSGEVASAQHLVDVHDHLRRELTQIQSLIRQVADGAVEVGDARQHLNQMVLRSNRWTVGAHCADYCYLLTAHHTLEDQAMLPGLRAVDARLGPVLDRLGEEHQIIHGVLGRLDAALVDFVADRGADSLRRAVDQLSDALLSHLSYEERELLEPLARAHLFG
jgi:Hemerythrin HHE cation binding domain